VTWDQICDVTASSTSVQVGDQVTVTGSGFFPNTLINVSLEANGNPVGAAGGPTDGAGTFVFTFTANQVGNWLVLFSQANGCSDSMTIAAGTAGTGPTPTPSGTGLPDAAAADPAESTALGWVLAGTLMLWIAFILAVATARSRRSG
jgi:hypothetical protein